MNIQKFGCQERIQQNHGVVNDYSLEYAKRISQQFNAQQNPHRMGFFHGEPQQQSFDQAHSSSSIVSRIGSTESAFYATERYMGFPQYGYQVSYPQEISKKFDAQIPSSYPQEISKKFDAQIPSSYQQSADSYYGESVEQAGPNFGSLQSAAEAKSCNTNQYNSASDKSYSERQQILQLKRKLLDDYDDPAKRQAANPFDANNDPSLSHNSYGYQLANLRQSAGTSGNAAAPSGSAPISNKTRIRWSQDLHDRFVECVNHLGGAEKATPKAILRLMESDVLTIYHVKSHLQKYRIAKYMPDSAEGKSERRTSMSDVEQMDSKAGMQLKEALQMQLDVQRRLHEQLEIQRNLQLRIEEQGKQLKMMFDQQHKTNKSALEAQNPNDKSPDDPNFIGLEDLIADASEKSPCPSNI